jgi:hypothetical protein
VVICLAASIFFGIYSVTLALVYRAEHALPLSKDWIAR